MHFNPSLPTPHGLEKAAAHCCLLCWVSIVKSGGQVMAIASIEENQIFIWITSSWEYPSPIILCQLIRISL
ncbi:hypothetical protein scyTo_0017891 [Scyliorhinus torazame]|uniref:Uncharacterized protein n=1 Tax=Scyliorhinus torazame TaxID=75743 RepID=A0A401Q229_SCYTO|nr:hypothetical protein [Scyliorhinus torazame]